LKEEIANAQQVILQEKNLILEKEFLTDLKKQLEV